ncbi:MAG: SPOR domain-containing protein, partial [bacterium]
AYAQAAYGRAVECARRAARSSQGVELDRARYIEGIGEWKLGRLPQGATLLAQAAESPERNLASDALVSLGSLEIERSEFDAAGRAYEKAAGLLEGTERRRAYGVAMRSYERAGLPAEAERLRTRAGLPPSDGQIAAVREADSVRSSEARPEITPEAKPEVKSEPASERAPTSAEVADRNGIASKPSPPKQRFAIQAGAFSEEARARAVAAEVATRAKGTTLGAPRIIEKESRGRRVYVVQIGSFDNRIEASKAMSPFSKMTFTVEPYVE